MLSIITALAQGDTQLPLQFAEAVEAWRGFHQDNKVLGDRDLARQVGNQQFRHELHFGGDRHLGKMSMPLAALAALYNDSDGFGENRDYAIRLVKAFTNSPVSVEVKGMALTKAIVVFGLEDDPVLAELVKKKLRL